MQVVFEDPGETLTEATLATFELTGRHRFPPKFRRFLLSQNGGEPKPNCLRAASTLVKVFFSVGPPTSLESDWREFKDETYPRVPAEFLPVALCEGGDRLCVVKSGPKIDQIFFWNHDGDEVLLRVGYFRAAT